MSIIVENQNVNAGIAMEAGAMRIEFPDEPAMVLGETVLIDLMQRSIGIIYQSTYHHIGDLPAGIDERQFVNMARASLSGHGADGQEIHLQAPIKIVKN